MAHLIKQNHDIRGISVNGIECVLAQFADNMNLFLTYEKLCIDEVCNTLTHVENNLGLRVLYEKTDIYTGLLHCTRLMQSSTPQRICAGQMKTYLPWVCTLCVMVNQLRKTLMTFIANWNRYVTCG